MRNRSLSFKVAGIVFVMAVGAIVIAGIAFLGLSKINKILTHATTITAHRIHLDHSLKELFLVQIINERNYVLNSSGEARAEAKKLILEREKQIDEVIESRKKIAGPAGLKDLAAFKEAYGRWKAINAEVVGKMESGDEKGAIELLLAKGRAIRLEITELTDGMVKSNTEDMDIDRADAEKTFAESRTLMLVVTVLSMLIGIVLSVIVMRGIRRAIDKVINDLTTNSHQVTQASEQIATTSTQLAEASTEQAASLEETVATLEELSSMIKMNSENASQAAKMSDQTETVARKGDEEIKKLTSSMSIITQDSKKIEEIITVIDDIAFQTNLLALNASVEAARAGEQGRGFAIVADAVRGLAQRSATAAKEITDLIKGSVAAIETGSKEVQSSADTLREIVNYSQKVKEINREISSASDEQARGIEQISKAMNQLDQAVQVNAASSEEASAAAQELSAQANQLNETVGILEVTIKGN